MSENELTLCSKLKKLILSYPSKKKYLGLDTPKTYFKILQTIPASANEKTKCLQTRDVYAKRSFTFSISKSVWDLIISNFFSF